MPMVVPLLGAAFVAAGSVLTAVGVTATIAGIAISTIATVVGVALMAVSMLMLAPKIPSQGQQLDTMLDPKAAVPVIYGRTAAGGTVVYRDVSGKKNKLLHTAIILSMGGPVANIEKCYADDLLLTFTGDPITAARLCTGTVPTSKKLYQSGTLAMRYLKGEAPATETLTGAMGAYGGMPDSPGKVSGAAMAIFRAEHDTDNFPNGLPKMKWVVSGVGVYDPRKDDTYPGGSGTHRIDDDTTWTYSDNPYLCALNWTLGKWHNGQKIYGIGAKPSEIDIAAFVAGANVADANGWHTGGVVTTGDDKFAVLSTILQSGGGLPIARGAQISCYVNAPITSVTTITREDIVGEVEIMNTTPYRSRHNTVVPSYREESQFWNVIQGEEVSSTVYIDEDNGAPKTQEVNFNMVQNAAQAHQLAAYELVNSREFLTFTLTGKLRLLDIRVGDAAVIDVEEFAADAVKCLCISREFDPSGQTVKLTFKSENNAKHAFALGQSQLAPDSIALNGYDPTDMDAPAADAWVVIGDTIVGESGNAKPILRITGSYDTPFVRNIIVQLRVFGQTGWQQVGVYARDTTAIEVSGVTAGTQYEVAISYVSILSALSDQTIYGPVTAGDETTEWDTVTGSGKPQDGATVGAPDGTYVGDRLAEEVNADLNAAQAQITLHSGNISDLLTSVDSLTAVYGDTAAAAQSAVDALNAQTAAEAAQAGAETAKTNAEAAKALAESAEANAQTSATAAATSAGNAATYASQASTSKDDAAGSASAAATSQTAAANSQTAAAGSATAAANSASTASTKANEASNSASSALSSSTSAATSSKTAAILAEYPIRPTAATWSPVANGSGVPEGLADETVAASGGANYINLAGNTQYTGWKKTMPVKSGRTYRTTIVASAPSGSATMVYFPRYLTSTYSANSTFHSTAVTVSSTAQAPFVFEWTATSSVDAYPNLRPCVKNNDGVAPIYIWSMLVEDVTSELEAAGYSSSAQTYATNASTSATNAAGSASTASTQAGAAATSASNAAGSASAASTSKTQAATSATNAANSATAASNSSTSASTSAGNASTSASQASSSATNAANSASSAASSATVAASVGQGVLNANPVFSDWTSTLPEGWADWSSAAATIVKGTPGRNSPYYAQFDVPAGTNRGLQQTGPAGTGLGNMGPGTYIVECDFELVSGDLQGAGVLFRGYNSGGTQLEENKIHFYSEFGAGTVGKVYSLRKTVTLTSTSTAKGYLWCMAGWTSFNGTITAKNIKFYRCAVRLASDAEASVSVNSGAIATLSGKTQAYWQVLANAGTSNAIIGAKADGTSSVINIAATKVQISNTAGSAFYDAIVFENGNATLAGTLRANSVEASHISVPSLAAITATIGTLRTAASGARTEIKDNVILVYDSSNVLRVRLGLW